MDLITTGSMMHVYGGFGAGVDYTGRTTVRLADPVDPGMLRRALDQTQKRYPYLCVTLKRGENIFYYEENPRPVALLHGDGRVSLNEEETNYHVWAVSYNEDRIHLEAYHGITDGTGMYRILATLLYYYCAERYGVTDHEGIRLAGDPISPEETEDPLDTLCVQEMPGIPETKFVPAFTLETDGGLTPSGPTIWDVEISEKDFIRFTANHDASPGTMISLLLARAVDALYPDREKDIVSAYVINARPMLKAVPTYHNCLGMAVFDYDSVKGMHITRQGTIYRGKTFLQSSDDVIRKSASENAALVKKTAEGAKSLEDKKEAFAALFNGGEGFFTFLVSYPGKWAFPALGDHIREFWLHPPNTFSLMVEINAAGGKIFLSVQQRFKEDCVREAFLKQLEIHGLHYKVDRILENDIAHLGEP